MKHSFKIFSLLFILLSWTIVGLMMIFILQVSRVNSAVLSNQFSPLIYADQVEENIAKRETITFILGEDNDPQNQYYTKAESHYRSHPSQKNEWIVKHCRSLKSVRDYLEQYNNGQPWGRINLVVHSNEWLGLGLPVFENGKKNHRSVIDKGKRK